MAGAMGRHMTTMLVTRPEPDAQSSVLKLEALGIEAIAAPVMVRQTLDASLPAPDGFAAMALTSTNGLRALAERGQIDRFRHLPVFTVGSRTAFEAREHGFADVSSADGAFADLVNLIARARLAGPIFYPAAKHQSGDLGKALAPFGVMVATARLYEMVALDALPDDALARLAAGSIGAVLIYSRRTAEIFAQLADSLDRAQRSAIAMLVMSEAVAEPLMENHFNRISLADRPDEDGMMTLALAFAREQTGS